MEASSAVTAVETATFSVTGIPRGSSETLVCFSHLRWDFVFQRPQHLMTRFARDRRVVIWEEPGAPAEGPSPVLDVRIDAQTGVTVVTPRLSADQEGPERDAALQALLTDFLKDKGPIIRWYYTPMMLPFSREVDTVCTVFDCMDELSAFRFAPPELLRLEQELLDCADVVFTGGYSLYEAKRASHKNIHPFPSSVDRNHFSQARQGLAEPADQAGLARPRLGFYGVIDERMDLDLLASIADARPEWSLAMVGPVVKIDPADLPQRENIHYLGGKSYGELPAYLAGWDVALMPFAINEATRFISPTKTPEYLAAGRPVVSTPIIDVVRHYGELDGVGIGDTAEAFIAACDAALMMSREAGAAWLEQSDMALAELSWDRTAAQMNRLIEEARSDRAAALLPLAAPAIRAASRRKPYDFLVVGGGFAGSVLAERLAEGLNKRVLLIDRRSHIAGNAYDHHDAAGIMIHRYGPHIFHTNSMEIASYLSRFTAWRPYEHRVLASVDRKLTPMPINRTTLNMLYGLDLRNEEEAAAFLASRAEPVETIRTSRDVVVSAIGRDLYETFFEGYTRKQWGLDPSQLDKSVTSRVPTRTNTDDRYFTDAFQAMPAQGYTAMFERMLDHPNIDVMLGVDFEDVRDEVIYNQLIYTGPVDEYFDYRFGPLPYRCLTFKHETLDQEWLQAVGVVNYPSQAVPYTRITEYKHLTGQTHRKTSITYEYPGDEGDPYYPVPRAENQALYKQYEALALQARNVTFAGRLATYRYYNMDQVVGQALATFRRIAKSEGRDLGDTTAAAPITVSAS